MSTLAQAAKKRWQNPLYRKRMKALASNRLKKLWKDPAYRLKMSRMSKKNWKNPDYKKRISDVTTKRNLDRWRRPENRKRQSRLLTEIARNRSSTTNKKIAMAVKEMWKDSAYRERLSVSMTRAAKKRWENSDYRKSQTVALSKGNARRWSDPKFRKVQSLLISKRMLKKWQDPKARKQQSEMKKKQWANPEYARHMLMSAWPHKTFLYHGRAFKSKWEVRFAQWLDASRLEWQYEPGLLKLSNCSYYPDFFVKQWNCYVEIKGWRNVGKSVQALKEGYPVLTLGIGKFEEFFRWSGARLRSEISRIKKKIA
jgi:hypothetical protein